MKIYRTIRASVSVTLLAILGLSVDWSAILSVLSTVSSHLFVLGLMLNFLATVVSRSIFTWALVDRAEQPRLWDIVSTFWALRFFSVVLPKAVVIALRWRRIKALFGRSASYSMAIISYEALISCLVMSVGALVFALIEFDAISRPIFWAIVSGSFVAGFLMIMLSIESEFSLALMGWLRKSLGSSEVIGVATAHFSAWRESMRMIGRFQSSRRFLTLLGCSLFFYLGFISSGYVLFLSLGGEISYSGIAWIRSIVWIATMLPISLGGLGVREAGFGLLLADYGYSLEFALAYALLSYAVQALIGIGGGVLDLFYSFLGLKNAAKR